MIPTDLQDGLEKRFTTLFEGHTYKNPNGNEPIPLNIFKQHLPEKPKDDLSLYPYVIIQLSEGEQTNAEDPSQVKMVFIIGVFDDENTYQGYRDVANIIQKIYGDLMKNPSVNRQFEMKFPIRWSLYDEDTFPFYFGGIETYWDAPTISRNDVEALI